MQMTESEIYAMYREAADKRKQIQILAELNDCRQRDIKDILSRYAEESEPPETAVTWEEHLQSVSRRIQQLKQIIRLSEEELNKIYAQMTDMCE